MRRSTSLVAAVLAVTVPAAAQEAGETEPQWGFLAVSVVLLAALALYIYHQVRSSGFFTVFPQTAAEDEG